MNRLWHRPKGRLPPGQKGEADRDAEQALRRIADDYSHFHMTRLGDTHAKVLICDSRFSVVTSFNWLSFRGDSYGDGDPGPPARG